MYDRMLVDRLAFSTVWLSMLRLTGHFEVENTAPFFVVHVVHLNHSTMTLCATVSLCVSFALINMMKQYEQCIFIPYYRKELNTAVPSGNDAESYYLFNSYDYCWKPPWHCSCWFTSVKLASCLCCVIVNRFCELQFDLSSKLSPAAIGVAFLVIYYRMTFYISLTSVHEDMPFL